MKNKDGVSFALRILCILLIPAACFYLSHYMVGDVFGKIKPLLQLYNIAFYEVLSLFLIALTGSAPFSLVFLCVSSCLFGLLNAYVFRFRGSFVMPWDFMSAQTAANVAGNFDYTPTRRMVALTLAFAVLIVLSVILTRKTPEDSRLKKPSFRIALLAGSVTAGVILYLLLMNENVQKAIRFHEGNFQIQSTTTRNGLLLGFIFKTKYFLVQKPPDYSAAEEKAVLDSMDIDTELPETLPDVVVIMNEAFSDPAVYGEIKTSEDYMPFIHSLNGKENTVTGYVDVSVNGGNTPNSEFEFLTGNSLAFLPEGCIPFQNYVNRDMDSLASYFKSLGYDTLAMHPYLESGWDRTKVYPLLGFDEMHFLDYFEGFSPKYVRDYVSDESLYDQIIYELENRKDPSKRMFSFNVTMQNHSDYGGDFENFERTVFPEGEDRESEDAVRTANYLTLIKISDDAFRKFAEYISDCPRPTVIVMFGDHQPAPKVFRPFFKELGLGGDEPSEEEMALRYKVPFVILANYDIEEAAGMELGLNYLGNLLLKETGIPLTRYRSFTNDFSRDYPVISAGFVRDASGNLKAVREEATGLLPYSKMQYYEMFDDNDDYE
ncbi:MAG: LTA synthase family protein [Lachnospiraceae bacterium]|nr:LTA synthase family protein [Lachnospiraceae bacterium]